jgi:hypothetical protein
VLAQALALQGKSRESLAAAGAAWPHLRAEGDEIRVLPVVALAAAQLGRLRPACWILGSLDAAVERFGLVRPLAEFGEDVLLERLLQALTPEEVVRERAAGARLDMEAAFAHACSDTSAFTTFQGP